MRIFHFNEQGALLGEGRADADPMQPERWLIPAQSTTIEPPTALPGHHVLFDGSAWKQEPLPEPIAEMPVNQPSAADLRRFDIHADLTSIDYDSVRPSRAIALAIAAGQVPAAADVAKLAELEQRAEALRNELRALS